VPQHVTFHINLQQFSANTSAKPPSSSAWHQRALGGVGEEGGVQARQLPPHDPHGHILHLLQEECK
jgi:hypothetical protein